VQDGRRLRRFAAVWRASTQKVEGKIRFGLGGCELCNMWCPNYIQLCHFEGRCEGRRDGRKHTVRGKEIMQITSKKFSIVVTLQALDSDMKLSDQN
jgi:hypothetical protein